MLSESITKSAIRRELGKATFSILEMNTQAENYDPNMRGIEVQRAWRYLTQTNERAARNDPTLHVHLKGQDPREQCEECAVLSDEELTKRLKSVVEVEAEWEDPAGVTQTSATQGLTGGEIPANEAEDYPEVGDTEDLEWVSELSTKPTYGVNNEIVTQDEYHKALVAFDRVKKRGTVSACRDEEPSTLLQMLRKQHWLRVGLMTALLSIAIEITSAMFQVWDSQTLPHHPTTLPTPWLVFALYGLGLVGKKVVRDVNYLFLYLLFGAFLVSIVWMVIPGHCDLYKFNWTGSIRYAGIQTQGDDYDDGEETASPPPMCYHLHSLECPELASDIAVLESKNEQDYEGELQTINYHFWQSGLAHGFTPHTRCIPEYRAPSSLMNLLEFWVTVGPVLVVESVLKGLLRGFLPLLCLQLLCVMIKLTRPSDMWNGGGHWS